MNESLSALGVLGIEDGRDYTGPSIIDAFEEWAERSPERPFLSEGEQTWTWASFRARVGRMARAFADTGVGFGDRVVLYIDRKSDHVAGYLAALSIGAIAVHVFPERTWTHVTFVVEAIGASAVLCTRTPPPELRCRVCRPPDDTLEALAPQARRHEVAYIMFTSGTTSTPKAVVTTQANVLAVTRVLIEAAAMRTGDRELSFMPLGSTGGAGHLHAIITLGNHARLLPWFLAEVGDAELRELISLVEREEIDGMLTTPGLIIRLLRDHREGWARAGQRLRYLLANVTPMRREVIVDLLETLPELRLVTYYGLTEASRSVINVCRDNPGFEHASGWPAPGVDVRVADPEPETGVGELCLRGANVAPGYWDGGRTDEADGWFRTGDWGRIDEAGRVFALGRIKETINVDGLKCRPAVIEAVLAAHPAVSSCAVVALPDPDTHHHVGAAVILTEKLDRPAIARVLDELLARCRERLPHYMVPASIHVVAELPRTDLGKLQRHALVERLCALERSKLAR